MQEERSADPGRPAAAGPRAWIARHPRLVSWLVLAVGMVAMVAYASRDVGLLPSQLATILIATVGLAGLCVWIINWE